ncbi:MAG: hypothetical protein SOW08_13120 [Lachnospiraceae bacterium]|nr:hypothetical protein [Lachnospiraceae bacterium]
MKKIYLLVVILNAVFLCCACNKASMNGKGTDQVPDTMTRETDSVSTESPVMEKCVVSGEGRVVRFYAEPVKSEYEVPAIVAFDIYDLIQKKVLGIRNLQEYRISSVDMKTGVNTDGFYIFSHELSSYLFFSQEGKFVSQIKLPVDCDRAVCLSDDLSELVYQSQEPDGDGKPLIVKNLKNGEEKVIYTTAADVGCIVDFEDLFLNKDKTRIGFKGQTIPEVEEQSVDCYGYIDLDTGQVRISVEEDITAACVEDQMVVFDKVRSYGKEGSGTVLLFDMQNLEKKEISTITKEESQFVYPVSKNLFFTVIDRDGPDGKRKAIIRKYEDGRNTDTVEYSYKKEMDPISALDYDETTGTLFIQSYSMEKLNYVADEISLKD